MILEKLVLGFIIVGFRFRCDYFMFFFDCIKNKLLSFSVSSWHLLRTMKNSDYVFLILFVLFFGSALSSLYAQKDSIVCQGEDCPFGRSTSSQNINDLLLEVPSLYSQIASKNFSNAHAIANVTATPAIGDLKISNTLTIGGSLQGGYDGEETVDADVESFNLESIRLDGIIGHGLGYIGINFAVFDVYKDLLKNIDLYFGMGSIQYAGFIPQSTDTNTRIGYLGESFYVGLRYKLIDASSQGYVAYSGLSFHTGYIDSRSGAVIEKADTPDDDVELLDYDWDGVNELQIDSKIETIIFELNTGFKLLFLRLNVGGGIAFSDGETRLSILRRGALSNVVDGTNMDIDANVTIRVLNTNELENDSFIYTRYGIEIAPSSSLRFGLEYIVKNLNSKAIHAGARIEL